MSLFSKARAVAAGSSAPEEKARRLWPRHAFEASMAYSLRLLRQSHVPLTLFAVELPARGLVEANDAVGEALSPLGVVGRLPDGRIGLLYLGPHSLGADAEQVLARHILDKIEGRLRDQGWGPLCRGLKLTAAHAWSDAIAGPAQLLAKLDERRGPYTLTAREPRGDARPHQARARAERREEPPERSDARNRLSGATRGTA